MNPSGGPSRAPSPPWSEWLDQRARSIRADDRWREPREFDALGPAGRLRRHSASEHAADTASTRPLVSFASNDYLGLSAHPAVVDAAVEALRRWGAGSGASRLVTGSRPVHTALESGLAEWKGTESALLFSSGYAANVGVLAVAGEADVLIVSDGANHASIIDGARLARANVAVVAHGDVAAMAERVRSWPGRSVVVSDAVFSMDGDAADVDALTELAADTGALLVLDEAHSLWGPTVPEPDGDVEVVRVGTLSKTFGAVGGFVASSRPFRDLLVNLSRPFIFSTAGTPADAAGALAALEIIRSSEGAALVERVRSFVDRLAPGHPSAIVPIITGSERTAIEASTMLAERGLWVPAIRPPTVPRGTSRLRVTFSAAHRSEDVDLLLDALAELGREA